MAVAGLETERLELAPRSVEHIEAIARMDRDADVYRYSEVRASADAHPPAKAALRKAMLSEIEQEPEKPVWAILQKPDRGIVGVVVLATEAPTILGFPRQPGTLFLSYRLARQAWGQGFATEAAAAARNYGFRVLGARAIVAFSHAANARSRRVLEKLGLTAAGMMVARAPGAGRASASGQLYVCFRTERSGASGLAGARRSA